MNPLPTRVNNESIATYLSQIQKQKDADRQVLLKNLLETLKTEIPKKCYRCDKANFQTKGQYLRHCVIRHPGLPAYPGPADILAEKLQSQNMLWEK